LELRKKLEKGYIWNIAFKQMKEDVLVELGVGLLWLKLHSTRRGLFLLAHWTWN
jgi:hypothetical protein